MIKSVFVFLFMRCVIPPFARLKTIRTLSFSSTAFLDNYYTSVVTIFLFLSVMPVFELIWDTDKHSTAFLCKLPTTGRCSNFLSRNYLELRKPSRSFPVLFEKSTVPDSSLNYSLSLIRDSWFDPSCIPLQFLCNFRQDFLTIKVGFKMTSCGITRSFCRILCIRRSVAIVPML